MKTAELETQEKAAFLDWRRGLAEYVVVPPSILGSSLISVSLYFTDFKNKKTFYLLRSSAIWKFGANSGVSWNVPILLYRLLTRVTLYASAVKIWNPT